MPGRVANPAMGERLVLIVLRRKRQAEGCDTQISKCLGTYGQIILLILLSLSQKENLCG